MFQIDFQAFYDAIPIPEDIRSYFVFRAKDGTLNRLKTLPTGARWSVTVVQAITWTIIDVQTDILIDNMIDNILFAAREGQEQECFRTIRTVISRIRAANLITSLDRRYSIIPSNDSVWKPVSPACFWARGVWAGSQREVQNSTKTSSKLSLAVSMERFTLHLFDLLHLLRRSYDTPAPGRSFSFNEIVSNHFQISSPR